MSWKTERRVGGDCVDSEAGVSAGVRSGRRGERVVKVRTPIVSYKCLERRVEDEVWGDGFRYERAMFRI